MMTHARNEPTSLRGHALYEDWPQVPVSDITGFRFPKRLYKCRTIDLPERRYTGASERCTIHI